jgi:hypothetical protein
VATFTVNACALPSAAAPERKVIACSPVGAAGGVRQVAQLRRFPLARADAHDQQRHAVLVGQVGDAALRRRAARAAAQALVLSICEQHHRRAP